MQELLAVDVEPLIAACLITDGLWVQELPSTNTRLLEDSPFSGEAGLYLLGCDRQSNGRGRHSNRWRTTAGALTFSLLLVSRAVPELLAIRVAVAIASSLDGWLACQSEIKWPNDVMVGERKVAGILIEARPAVGTVIGVGININNRTAEADESIRSTMTSLSDETDGDVTRQTVLRTFLEYLNLALAQSSEDVITAVRGRNWLAGRTVAIVDGQDFTERTRGRVETIDSSGGLVLQQNDSLTTVYSGSVRVLA